MTEKLFKCKTKPQSLSESYTAKFGGRLSLGESYVELSKTKIGIEEYCYSVEESVSVAFILVVLSMCTGKILYLFNVYMLLHVPHFSTADIIGTCIVKCVSVACTFCFYLILHGSLHNLLEWPWVSCPCP